MICFSSNLANLSKSLERHMQIQGNKLSVFCVTVRGFIEIDICELNTSVTQNQNYYSRIGTQLFSSILNVSGKALLSKAWKTWRGPLLLLRQRMIAVSRISVKRIPGYICKPTSKKIGKLSFCLSSWKSEGEREAEWMSSSFLTSLLNASYWLPHFNLLE